MHILDHIRVLWEKFVAYTENLPIGFGVWLGTFSSIVFLRNVLEEFSQKSTGFPNDVSLDFFLHAYAFYLFGFVGLILILALATKERIERVSRFVLFIAPLILLPPIIDLAVTHGAGAVMGYRDMPALESPADIPQALIDFVLYSPYGVLFDGTNAHPLAQLEKNYGIRIEVLLELLLFFSYLLTKTKSGLRALGGLGAIYGGLFVLAGFPDIIAALFGASKLDLIAGRLSAMNPRFQNVNWIAFACFTLLIVLQAKLWYWAYDRKKFWAVARNIRPVRIAAHMAILALGLWLGFQNLPPGTGLRPFDTLILVSAVLSLAFYWLGAVMYNDITDEVGDRILGFLDGLRQLCEPLLHRHQGLAEGHCLVLFR